MQKHMAASTWILTKLGYKIFLITEKALPNFSY